MRVGFTGTQIGMTPNQKERLKDILTQFKHEIVEGEALEFHFGDCVGSDEEAAGIAKDLGYALHCHPPLLKAKRAFVKSDVTYPADEYLTRNHHIVHASFSMIATPKEEEEQLRSGTWATVRYARKCFKPLYLVKP